MSDEKKDPGTEKTDLLPKAVPANQWTDGVCGCFNDCGMCVVIGCCNSISLGQLYERMVKKGMLERAHSMATCVNIAVFLWVCYLVSDVLEGAGGSASDPNYAPTTTSVVLHTIGSLISFISCLCGVAIVMTVRRAVRGRDQIEPQNCGDSEDIICALCCNPCTQCQIWRHEKVACSSYQLFHETGAPIESVVVEK